MLAVVLADLVDRHDAGVVEQGDRLGLVPEPAQLVVAGEHAGPDHLQGDGPVEADLPGLVDDAHAAAAQLAPDLVVAEVADHGAPRARPSPSAWPLPEASGAAVASGSPGAESIGRPVGLGSLRAGVGRLRGSPPGWASPGGRRQGAARVSAR